MAAQVKDQVFTDNAHQVVADHADIVFRSVFADVGVDGGKPLGNGAASVHGGLVDQQDFLVAGPFLDFKGSAAGSHAAADDEDVNFALFSFGISYGLEFTQWFIR